MSGLRVVQPGTFTTVQDLGRPGHRGLGVSPAGAFDRAAHALANALVASPPGAATLELTLLGGVFTADHPLALALAGAPMTATLEADSTATRRIPVPSAFTLLPGQILRIGGTAVGARAYLATHGGWQTDTILGSRSAEPPLAAGTVLPAAPARIPSLRPRVDPMAPVAVLHAVDGPDADAVPPGTWRDHRFRVEPLASRAGVRLRCDTTPDLPSLDPDRLSAPVVPGALQWTGAGWILLGAACGTMGGYPHAAQVVAADLDRLAQLRPGQNITLRRVTREEAHALDEHDRTLREPLLLRVRTLAVSLLQPGG
jgi:antagonist of KipI